MSDDIYARVSGVVEESMEVRAYVSPEDMDAKREWLEHFVQDVLRAIRPEPSRDVSEVVANDFTQVRIALSNVESAEAVLRAMIESPEYEHDQDAEHMLNALRLCAWVLSPWRRRGSRGGRGGRRVADYGVRRP